MNKIYMSLLLCLTLFIPQAIAAKNINELVEQGKLTITLAVPQGEPQIVGQALVVSIDVATDSWFATGSKVQSFIMPDVVMQTNNITTINGNDRINGKTWATQTHEITLYPTLPGKYQLPKFIIDVSVNSEHDGIINGVLTTEEASFDIVLPEALNGIEQFIVSPEVTLIIDGQFDANKDYPVGDAITQTFTITATDTPAMMIPEINITNASKSTSDGKESLAAALDGISIYHKPAQILDKSNRGTSSGTRIESFTYIFENAGTYKLPEQVIYWWNSQDKILEELIIPAATWTVSGGGLLSKAQKNHTFSELKINVISIIILVIFVLGLFLIYFIFSKRQWLFNAYKKITHYEQRKLRQLFFNNIVKQDYLKATNILYLYALLQKRQIFIAYNKQALMLNKLAYSSDADKNNSRSFTIADAKLLIKAVDTSQRNTEVHENFTPNEKIILNK